jgi:hypothetical protein
LQFCGAVMGFSSPFDCATGNGCTPFGAH